MICGVITQIDIFLVVWNERQFAKYRSKSNGYNIAKCGDRNMLKQTINSNQIIKKILNYHQINNGLE